MGMVKFKAPALPLPMKEYNEGQQDQLLRALRLYFNQLDSRTPITSEEFIGDRFTGGIFSGFGQEIIQPHAMLLSEQDQASGGITSENLIEFDTVAFAEGISVNGPNDTRIQPDYPGQYLVTFSLQVTNRSNNAAEFEVWAKDAGVNYPLSNTRFDIPPRKSNSVWSHIVPAVSGIFTVTDPATEYLEIAWWASDPDVFLEYYPAGTSPDRPAISSVILTINLVSALP